MVLVLFTLHVGVPDEVERTGAPLDVVHHAALSVDPAGSRELAEVDTVSVLTGLGGLAVPVGETLHPPALLLGVALQSLGTGTDRSVVGDDTLGGGGTVGGEAGVLAGAVTADLLVTTVSVQETAGETGAALAEVALGTGDRPTALLATLALHTALATLTVRPRPAGLDTDPVLAPVAPPAVRGAGAGEGEGETLRGGVTGGGGRAGAESLVVPHLTLGTGPAGRAGAGVPALRGDTGLATGALVVTGTARHTEPVLTDGSLATVRVGVTQRSADGGDTDLVEEAGLGCLTGGDTLALQTLVPGPALAGGGAGPHRVRAGPGGVSGQWRRTGAEGLVLADGTESVTPALSGAGGAGIHTLVVDTGQRGGTAGAGPAAQDTGHTLTDLLAVTVSVHSTHRLAESIVADLVVAAGLVVEADVLTELAVADLSLGALGVAGADLWLLDTGHGGAGVGDVAEGTGAGCAVVDHLTLGVRSAGSRAGVRTSVVDTGVGLGTVLVLPAAHQAHLVETDVSEETVIVHPAGHCKESY